MQNASLPNSLERHRLLNTSQMSAALGYCCNHLRKITREGKFPKPVRIGRRMLWPASVLIELASGQPEKAA